MWGLAFELKGRIDKCTGLVAQWIARPASDREVVGSSPIGVATFCLTDQGNKFHPIVVIMFVLSTKLTTILIQFTFILHQLFF